MFLYPFDMTDQIVRIQVPLEAKLRDDLAERAHVLGFDSIQAFLRFLAKAQIAGRIVVFGDERFANPAGQSNNGPATAIRLQADAEAAFNEYRRQGLKKSLAKLSKRLDAQE